MIFDQAWNRIKRMRLSAADPLPKADVVYPVGDCPSCPKGYGRPHERHCPSNPHFGVAELDYPIRW